MSWLGGQKDSTAGRSGIVTVLDVGSTKVCCVIGRLKPCEESERLPGRTHKVKVIGIGHQKSQGVKSGTIWIAPSSRSGWRWMRPSAWPG